MASVTYGKCIMASVIITNVFMVKVSCTNVTEPLNQFQSSICDISHLIEDWDALNLLWAFLRCSQSSFFDVTEFLRCSQSSIRVFEMLSFFYLWRIRVLRCFQSSICYEFYLVFFLIFLLPFNCPWTFFLSLSNHCQYKKSAFESF